MADPHDTTPVPPAADPAVVPLRTSREGFSFVATPVPVTKELDEAPLAAPRGTGLATTVVVVFFLVAVVLMLGWYFTRSARPHVNTAEETAQAYLTALAVGDTATMQQLATTSSKSVMLPPWFTVIRGVVMPTAAAAAPSAELEVELYLSPTDVEEDATPALLDALSRHYAVALVLERDGNNWRIDQHATFSNLRDALTQENPEITFPAWE